MPLVPPLWKRVLLLPFLPPMWADARNWPAGAVVVPLFLSATLWSGALATYRAVEFRGLMNELADSWDTRFDPLVIENGVARVEGKRLPEAAEGGSLMLADPEETRPTPQTGRYIIVRKREVIRGDGPPVKLDSFQEMLGEPLIRVDTASMRTWLAKWGLTVQFGMIALLVGFEWLGVLVSLLYGLLIGAMLTAMLGKSRGLTSAQCTRVGLATMAVKPVLSVGLALVGTGVNACLGLIVWPALGLVLGAVALSLKQPSSADAPGGNL